jgi:hypothetical protein
MAVYRFSDWFALGFLETVECGKIVMEHLNAPSAIRWRPERVPVTKVSDGSFAWQRELTQSGSSEMSGVGGCW